MPIAAGRGRKAILGIRFPLLAHVERLSPCTSAGMMSGHRLFRPEWVGPWHRKMKPRWSPYSRDLEPGGGEDGLAIFVLQRPVSFDGPLWFRDHALAGEDARSFAHAMRTICSPYDLHFQESVLERDNDRRPQVIPAPPPGFNPADFGAIFVCGLRKRSGHWPQPGRLKSVFENYSCWLLIF